MAWAIIGRGRHVFGRGGESHEEGVGVLRGVPDGRYSPEPRSRPPVSPPATSICGPAGHGLSRRDGSARRSSGGYQGCLQNQSWCDVATGIYRGWVYGEYLAMAYGGQQVLVPEYAPVLGVPVIGFNFARYWNRYYQGAPWWGQYGQWQYYTPRPRPGWGPPPAGPGPRRPAGGIPAIVLLRRHRVGLGRSPAAAGRPGWGVRPRRLPAGVEAPLRRVRAGTVVRRLGLVRVGTAGLLPALALAGTVVRRLGLARAGTAGLLPALARLEWRPPPGPRGLERRSASGSPRGWSPPGAPAQAGPPRQLGPQQHRLLPVTSARERPARLPAGPALPAAGALSAINESGKRMRMLPSARLAV